MITEESKTPLGDIEVVEESVPKDGKPLVSFSEAIKALKQGKRVQRYGWNGKGLFVFIQVPSNIDVGIVVPKMQSLPQSVKDEFVKRLGTQPLEDHYSIRYRNQMCVVYPDNSIHGWSPSSSDSLAEDWIILD
jgi:hypothetical protein